MNIKIEGLQKMKRDLNIIKAYKRELNLSPRIVKDKTKYTRKAKHTYLKGLTNEN